MESERIRSFIDATGSNEQIARTYLDMAFGDVNQAVQLFLEMDQKPFDNPTGDVDKQPEVRATISIRGIGYNYKERKVSVKR